jgi:ATP-dependent RNA helicase DDX60
MMLVLSHLFGRRVCRKTDDEALAEKIRRSSSMVYLPPLPEDATLVLRKHNTTTLSIFTTYVKTFAEQHVKGEERFLPLTGIAVGAPEQAESIHSNDKSEGKQNGSASSTMATNLTATNLAFLPTLPAPRARSAFVALSGHGDDFKTITDLCTSARSGIFLESAVIPHVVLHPDESRTPLNAYLLDFFIHGAVRPLVEANGIRGSDVWFVLNDFSLVLATIVTSLANYLALGTGDVNEEILETMGSGDTAENEGDEKLAVETESVISSTSAQSSMSVTASRGAGNKKSKVAEDWDADEEDEFEEEDQSRSTDVETDDEEYKKLMNVYRAFKMLKAEFDIKFLKIWA